MDSAMLNHTAKAMRHLVIAATLLSLFACDKSGLHDLGRAKDTPTTCGTATTTWVRSLEDTTELFVLGTERAGMGSSDGCYVRALVNQDSSVEMETGYFSVNSMGIGTTQIYASYTFMFQPDRSPLQRDGAERLDQDLVRVAMAIERRGVEPVDAVVERAANGRDRAPVLDVLAPPRAADRPAAKAERRELQVRAGEGAEFHRPDIVTRRRRAPGPRGTRSP